ncbi:glutamyl-tRNA reductase [bacterium]|nr:glutamyl-tRNA reductase [bacterium]
MLIRHTLVLGLSYHTSTSDMRDKARFPAERQELWAKFLLNELGICEVLLLPTCNRVEAYLTVEESKPLDVWVDLIQREWAKLVEMEFSDLKKVLYVLKHGEAVNHLYRVVCSLDSLVLGEGQIMGQVKEAYKVSVDHGTVGLQLHQLFQRALSTGKRVRTETTINQGAVSISYAAVELAKKILGELDTQKALLVGAGEMSELAASHLVHAGVKNPVFVNRSLGGATRLAGAFQGEAHELPELVQAAQEIDILISCTAAREYVLTVDMIKDILLTRKKRTPLLLIDIAAPQDIEPECAKLPGVYAFNIDDLQSVTDDNRSKRKTAVAHAERIIEEEISEFKSWYQSQEIVPTIVQLREQTEAVLELELEHYQGHCTPEEYELLKTFGRSLTRKILHKPSVGLRNFAESGLRKEAEDFTQKLFLLNKEE